MLGRKWWRLLCMGSIMIRQTIMKILVLALLFSLASPRLWLSLDQKYLYQLNDYLAQKVKAEMEGQDLGQHYKSWNEETRIGRLERHLEASRMILQTISVLKEDFKVDTGKMYSKGESNYTCLSHYKYYDHLDRAQGQMLVDTDMLSEVTIQGSCDFNITSRILRVDSRVTLDSPAPFLENELDRLYRAEMRNKVQKSVKDSVADILKNAFNGNTLLNVRISENMLYKVQAQKLHFKKGRLMLIADERLQWNNRTGKGKGRGLPLDKRGKDMTIGWDERSVNRFTDLQYINGGLSPLKDKSRLLSNITVEERKLGCSVRMLDLVFPGLKRHFRFQEKCYWTRRLAQPLESRLSAGCIKTKAVSQVSAVVGQQVGVDMLVTIEYTLRPYLHKGHLRLNATAYHLQKYQMLKTSRVQCKGAQGKAEREVYCYKDYALSQTRLWQMILLNYATQMKHFFNSQSIDISPLLNNNYYSFHDDVSLQVRKQTILLQGPLQKISLPLLFESLQPEQQMAENYQMELKDEKNCHTQIEKKEQKCKRIQDKVTKFCKQGEDQIKCVGLRAQLEKCQKGS